MTFLQAISKIPCHSPEVHRDDGRERLLQPKSPVNSEQEILRFAQDDILRRILVARRRLEWAGREAHFWPGALPGWRASQAGKPPGHAHSSRKTEIDDPAGVQARGRNFSTSLLQNLVHYYVEGSGVCPCLRRLDLLVR